VVDDACRGGHRKAMDVALSLDDVTGSQPNPDPEGLRFGQLALLDRDSTGERETCRPKRCQHAVPEQLHERAIVLLYLRSDSGGVPRHEGVSHLVPQAGVHVGRTDEVGEQDREHGAASHRLPAYFGTSSPALGAFSTARMAARCPALAGG
jgi:hypothetical protein